MSSLLIITVRFFFAALSLLPVALLAGCAGSPLRSDSGSTEEALGGDPVASVALQIRRSRQASGLSPSEQLRVETARKSGDVALGMPMEDVISLWGEPTEIHTAGSGTGNEKWVYFEGLSGQWRLSDSRVLYFEDGRVAGWEKVKAP